jgi:hypothetical protein
MVLFLLTYYAAKVCWILALSSTSFSFAGSPTLCLVFMVLYFECFLDFKFLVPKRNLVLLPETWSCCQKPGWEDDEWTNAMSFLASVWNTALVWFPTNSDFLLLSSWVCSGFCSGTYVFQLPINNVNSRQICVMFLAIKRQFFPCFILFISLEIWLWGVLEDYLIVLFGP